MKSLILCAVVVLGVWGGEVAVEKNIRANEEAYRKGNREFILNISGASPFQQEHFDEDIAPRIHRFRKRP